MKITADGEKLLVGDYRGHLILISSRDAEVFNDFGRALPNPVTGIMTTADEKFFFTASYDGVLIQWNYGDYTLAIDHGKIANIPIAS
jgi:hypothetical protein